MGAASTIQFRVLGPLQVVDGDDRQVAVGGPLQRAVLSALLLSENQRVTLERLIELVWGTDAPTDPRAAAHTAVSRLRRALPARIVCQQAGYRLEIEPEEVDVHRLQHAVCWGRELLADDRATEARSVLATALGWWRGEPLADLRESPLCAWARPWLRELCLEALETRVEADLWLERHDETVSELFELVAQHPMRERLYGQLMRALDAGGQRSEALQVYERARQQLSEELGVNPSPELEELFVQILSRDTTETSWIDPADAPVAPATEPASRRLADASDAGGVPLPMMLSAQAESRYVGRTGLVGRLSDTWRDVANGGTSRTVLLTGEPGVGKTRTAAETARQAFDKGAMVLYGRCDEDRAAPYQPFVEALDWQTTHQPAPPLGRFPGELVALLADLGERVAGLPAPVSADPCAMEHRLFEAVVSWIREASLEQGLLLVVDDLQSATKPTLQLLTHVGRVLAADPRARVLMVGTYRETEVERGHPLAGAISELRRSQSVLRHPVDRLSEDEVLMLLEETSGCELDEHARRWGEAAYAQTAGNPFFVAEVFRHATERGAVRVEDGQWAIERPPVTEVPDGIRDAVSQRLLRLSTATHDVLTVAATIDRTVDVEVVAPLVDGGLDTVLDALDEALAAQLVEEPVPGRFRFLHQLVRGVLIESLSQSRRRHLHDRITAVARTGGPLT